MKKTKINLNKPGFYAFIGGKRNIALDDWTANNFSTVLHYKVDHDINDLRDNVQNLYQAIAEAVGVGFLTLVIKNFEVGIPLGYLRGIMHKIKEAYPNVFFIISSETPMTMGICEDIFYFGDKKFQFDETEKGRLKYGNILDGFCVPHLIEEFPNK